MTLSLSDLTAKPVNVTVTTNYGRTLEVTLALPSYHRYREILDSVPAPVAPTKINAERKSVPDTDSPTYRAALQERATEQNYRTIVDALVRGGMPIEGETLAEQTETFRASEPDAGVCNALLTFLAEAVAGARQRADDAPFRPLPAAGDAGV